MPIQPEVRYFVPCWKEPTMRGHRPSAHEIMYSIQPKKGLAYPVWQRSYFILVVLANLHGVCEFHIETRWEELDAGTVIQKTKPLAVDSGNDPLRVQPISIMMNPVKLPKAGVYQVCLVCNNQTLARALIHAR